MCCKQFVAYHCFLSSLHTLTAHTCFRPLQQTHASYPLWAMGVRQDGEEWVARVRRNSYGSISTTRWYSIKEFLAKSHEEAIGEIASNLSEAWAATRKERLLR